MASQMDDSIDQTSSSSSDEDTSQVSDYTFIRPKAEVKEWDKFKCADDEATSTEGSASEQNTSFIHKASISLKVITISVTFFAVLGCSLVAKGATFFILSQITREKRALGICPLDFGNMTGPFATVVFEEKNVVAWLWCIFFVFLGPELLTFGRALRFCTMRSFNTPRWTTFGVAMAFETLHTVGLAILFYVALPHVDTARGIMATSGVCLLPAVLTLLNKERGKYGDNPDASVRRMKLFRLAFLALNVLAAAVQLAAMFIWLALDGQPDFPWALPVGLILTSFGWWECFVDECMVVPGMRFLWRVKTAMTEEGERYSTYAVVSLWKMAVFLVMFIVMATTSGYVEDASVLFSNFSDSFLGNHIVIHSQNNSIIDFETDPDYLPAKVLAVQLASAYVAYVFAKFACKVTIQMSSFALPLYLVDPCAMGILLGLCGLRIEDPCAFYGALPSHAFFECYPVDRLFTDAAGWVWFLWLVSQFIVTLHVWSPKSIRLAPTEQMFGTPFYCGLLADQSFLLNRRADSGLMPHRVDVLRSVSNVSNRRARQEPMDDDVSSVGADSEGRPKKISRFGSKFYDGEVKPSDHVIRVYGCATMWHENAEEMGEMLKSIFRMDEDSSARKYAKERLNVPDKDLDYFEWETHIFFDDAFEPDDSGKESVVNQFVRDLVAKVDEQGKKWYGSRCLKVPYPSRVPTPYGGRLVWVLPGQTKIVCHLKDKNKIRHKKRWSQCMYIYYFLGYMLEANKDLSEAQKDIRARNTFLLALDGDVDFQPDAIVKLVDLMKRNPDVGASCGRIHPTGSGYMQWYQMFEYAIGHWLQKSTEHIMGCVLCSPGCFSLFRGKALMANNVAKTYTTVSTEPRHFIQYDQGEDRWLCTLLLQDGWRVEYSAASDSFTACPEGFGEFYNQRRRWMPSTIANIMDLLGDYKRVIKNNDDISIFYIVYQTMMMIGTVLGPGSIYIMLCGALNLAFGMTNSIAFIVNLIPLVIFILICFYSKSETQILTAQVLSVGYALIMMAVLIGMLIQVAEDGLLAPSTLSLFFVVFVFILAGVLHPQELACLPMGVIYFITIPSMYLFLTIYSVFNLNVVSWGTREVPKKKTAEEIEQEKAAAEERAKNPPLPEKRSFLSSLFSNNSNLEFSMSRMFKRSDDQENLIRKDIRDMSVKLDRLEAALSKEGFKVPQTKPKDEEESDAKIATVAKPVKRTLTVRIVEPKNDILRNDLINPFWIDRVDDVGDGPKKNLPGREIRFWDGLIEKYLKPLEKDAEKEKQIGNALKELRNQMVFSFLMINSIWVLTIFLLQENKDLLYVEWPVGPMGPNITYIETPSAISIYVAYTYLQLEPIGLLFLVFFAFVLFVQLVGMLGHRIMTLGHIVSSTKLNLNPLRKKKTVDGEEFLNKNGLQMVKNIAKSFTPSSVDSPFSMEDLLDQALETLAVEEEATNNGRRVSENLIPKKTSELKRKETMRALTRRHTEGKRRATIKRTRSKNQDVITEDEEDEDAYPRHHPVIRTNTFKDPEGMTERDA